MNKPEFLRICQDKKFWKWVRSYSPISYPSIQDKDYFLKSIYTKIANRTYYPQPPEAYVTFNKGYGVLRVVPAFTLEDLCVYYYCSRKLEKYIAINRVPGTYGGFGISGRLKRIEENEINELTEDLEITEIEDVPYIFEEIDGSINLTSLNPQAWFEDWADFTKKLYLNSSDYKDGYVAELDISNFYDSIQLDNLEYKLRKHVPSSCNDVVYLISHFLRFWNRHINFYRQQGAGIPQDTFGECSRVLANFYLQTYDQKISEYCEKKGTRFFRYADDQVIFAKTKKDLEEIITRASTFLMRDGLNFNQKKVKIMKVKEFKKYYAFNSFFKLTFKEDTPINAKILEQQINFYFRNKKKLKKGGISLLRRIIGLLSKSKKKPKNFSDFKKNILNDFLVGNYMISRSDLNRIYKILTEREKDKMINTLNEMIEDCWCTGFLYDLDFFYKKHKIPTKNIRKRITFLKNFYGFIKN